MSLHNKMNGVDTPPIWSDPTFQAVLEDHMTYLRQESQLQSVEPAMVIKYTFDMFSFFRHYGVEDFAHWATMRVNGYLAPTDDFSDMQHFLVPSERALRRIQQQHQSVSGI